MILDLNNPPTLGNNLQTNLEKIKSIYGNVFTINYNDIKIPVKLLKSKFKYNPTLKYFYMIYDKKDRESELFPFKVDFFDFLKLEKNNNAYIANIHKTETISGTEMMNFILKFLKLLKAEYIRLYDDAHVNCTKNNYSAIMDLTILKLIQTSKTFYQKFGFKLIVGKSTDLIIQYKNDKNLNNAFNDSMKRLKKIETHKLYTTYKSLLEILNKVMINQDYDNIEIYFYHPIEPYINKKSYNREKVKNIINDIDLIMEIFNSYDYKSTKYFYQLLSQIAIQNCADYETLIEIIFENVLYIIKYLGSTTILKQIDIFYNLYKIRSYSSFELKL